MLLPPWDARVRDPVKFWGSVAGSAHIKPRFEHFHFWKPLHSSVDWAIRQLQRSEDSCWWICVLSYFVLFLGKRNLWTVGNLRDMLHSAALTKEALKWETQTCLWQCMYHASGCISDSPGKREAAGDNRTAFSCASLVQQSEEGRSPTFTHI